MLLRAPPLFAILAQKIAELCLLMSNINQKTLKGILSAVFACACKYMHVVPHRALLLYVDALLCTSPQLVDPARKMVELCLLIKDIDRKTQKNMYGFDE